MHLKELTLKGFKSFASATTLRFEPGVTAVVGPNGSGKSNIVDALAWVMGEQGARNLRGASMEDVIFAGTASRPALGRAQATLVIDNTDHTLDVDYEEVSVTRTMFRNGGSEYAINGTPCRLLDVQELLADAGLGARTHAIVGQGRLDDILRADPAGHRALIEEAAGILKHRRRKERALRKLEDGEANLNRLDDLLSEIRRQLGPLGRQARASTRAAALQTIIRDARARIHADDAAQAIARLDAIGAKLAEARAASNAKRGELDAIDRRIGELETQSGDTNPAVERLDAQWRDLTGIREQAASLAAIAGERAHTLLARMATVPPQDLDPDALDRQAETLAARAREARAEAERRRIALEDAETAYAEAAHEPDGTDGTRTNKTEDAAPSHAGLLDDMLETGATAAALATHELERLADLIAAGERGAEGEPQTIVIRDGEAALRALERARAELAHLEQGLAHARTLRAAAPAATDDHALERAGERRTIARLAHTEAVREAEQAEHALAEAARAARETRARLARIEEDNRRLRGNADTAGRIARDADEVAAAAARELDALEEERARLRAEAARHGEELRSLRARRAAVEPEANAHAMREHLLDVDRERADGEVAALAARAGEEFGMDLAELVAAYGPDQPVPASDDTARPASESRTGGAEASRNNAGEPSIAPRTVPYVRAEQVERLERARRDLDRLGAVNPLATEEYEALSARNRYLHDQRDDVMKSREDLMTLIERLDETMARQFREAFDDTAAAFETMFATLFPGGKGRLRLEDPDDPLRSGVIVEARPAGKRVKRLSLLSGGERSLTAMALLLAIFAARPGPFYVMDEVEAALDDVNLTRLLDAFARLRERSQLIVITHQQRTMSIADALYGVSMRADGATAVVSQRLEREPES